MKKIIQLLLLIALIDSCQSNETKTPSSDSSSDVYNPNFMKFKEQEVSETDSLTTAQARELVLKAKKEGAKYLSLLNMKEPLPNEIGRAHV